MKLAIMQPYFLPYLGYWQLMKAVDVFVVYDNIQYTKKGWINRNRYLNGWEPKYFSIPLKKDSDFLDIRDRRLAADTAKSFGSLSRKLESAYRQAAFRDQGMSLLSACLGFKSNNLFDFIHHSIIEVRAVLGIQSKLLVSSSLAVDNSLKAQNRVIATCQALGATEYVNPPGGRDLYTSDNFAAWGIKLTFLNPRLQPYAQASSTLFVPGLSILDVIAHVGIDAARAMTNQFDLANG